MYKLIGVLCAVTLYIVSVYPVSALTISPVKMELEGDPGQTIGGVFDLHNEEGNPRTLYVSYENFEPSGDLGTPRFVGASDGLATWLQATPELVLAVDERQTIPFTIKIPVDAKPGGYFAAVFYGGQDPRANGDGEVAIGGKLGMLILLRVRGDITEDGGINSFSTLQSERVFTSLPISFVTKMTNRGGDRITPRGSIVVKNIFGGTVTELEVNANEGSILPNSSRTYTEVWQGDDMSTSTSFVNSVAREWADFHFGFYKAKIALVWGQDEKSSMATYWLLIVPWHLLLVLLFGLVLFGLLLRSYNRFIIAKARRN